MVLQVLTIAAVRWDLCFRRHSITRERFPIVARTCVLVNSLSRVIPSQTAPSLSEKDSSLRVSLHLCSLCVLGGAGEWPIVAEFRDSSLRASVTPDFAQPLATSRIPTIPGRKTHFNS